MSKEIDIGDEELEALMAELEAQNDAIAAQNAPVAATTPHDENKAVGEVASPPESPAVEADAGADSQGEAAGDEIAELEAAMAELEASEVSEPAVTAPVAEIPAPAIEKLEKNGTDLTEIECPPDPEAVERQLASDQEAYAPLVKNEVTDKLSTPGNATVTINVNAAAPVRDAIREAVKEAVAGTGLSHYVDVDQFRIDTRVTEATLDACMIEQNGLRAWYGAQAARAEAQAGRCKAKFEVVEATLYDHHRKLLAASGEKTTEKMVENSVKLDPRWLKAKNLVIEAETIAAINKGLVESLRDRKDMIVQLGADRRDEFKGAARVMAEQNEREELRSRAQLAAQRAA